MYMAPWQFRVLNDVLRKYDVGAKPLLRIRTRQGCKLTSLLELLISDGVFYLVYYGNKTVSKYI